MKIGKYEFPDAATFETLWQMVDRDLHYAHEAGYLTGNYHVDVLWNAEKEPDGWAFYRVADPITNHRFMGFPYNQYKIE